MQLYTFSVLDHFILGLLALYTMLLHNTTKATQMHQQYLTVCLPHY